MRHNNYLTHRRWRMPVAIGLAGALALLGGCATNDPAMVSADSAFDGLSADYWGTTSARQADRASDETSDIKDAVPRAEAKSRYGNPKSYQVFGKRYYTKPTADGHVEQGLASWYGRPFHGRRTSSGETYDMYGMTAAHTSLPLPTYAKVTNMENGREVVVKVNDRGPFHQGRVIDLSYTAARKLGMVQKGTALVEVRAVGTAPVAEPRPTPETSLFLAQAAKPAPNLFSDDAAGVSTAPAPAVEKADAVQVAAAASPTTQSRSQPAGPRVAQAATSKSKPAKSQAKADKSRTRVAQAKSSKPTGQRVAAAKPAKSTTKAASGRQAPAKTVVAAASPASGKGTSPLYLQVGAFGSRLNAEQLRSQLVQHLAENVSVRASDGGKAPLYKVHVGPLRSQKKATDVSQQLAGLGVTKPMVVKD